VQNIKSQMKDDLDAEAGSVKLEKKADNSFFILVRVDADGKGPRNLDLSISDVINKYIDKMASGEIQQEIEKHFSEMSKIKK